MGLGNDEIEKAYLSVLMNGGRDVMGISEDNFHNPYYRKIFSVILFLLANGEEVDIVVVRDILIDRGQFELIGGNDTLISIMESFSHTSSMGYYANKLKKESIRGEVMKIAAQLTRSGEVGTIDSGEIIGFADKLLSLNNLDSSEYSLDSIIEETMETIEGNVGRDLLGYSFGKNLSFLDKYTRGIRRGRTYRFGAMSNVGKTQMSYNIIKSLLEQGKKVAFFSLENDKSFTICNLMANVEGVNSYSIEDGSHKADFGWLERYKDSFYLIDDEHELSRIFARILEIKPDVVFLDFIGLVEMKGVTEADMYTKYAKHVQRFVKKTTIPFIDLSNLPINATEETMRLSGHYFGSSYLRATTDVGVQIFYYKPFYDWRNSSGYALNDNMKNIQVVVMLISKNRIGTNNQEKVYKVDFNRGGLFIEATDEEVAMWKTGF